MSSTAEYLVGAVIGEGTFGHVVHAIHKTSQVHVAIKVIEKVALAKHPQWTRLVVQEQRLLQRFRNSPHIINLLSSFYDQECLYIVMEHASGGDLEQFIGSGMQKRRNNQWFPVAAKCALQILRAIEFLHAHRVIHTDIKPANILTKANGYIVMGDFGGAVDLVTLEKSARQQDIPLIIGTFAYACPEVIRGETNLTFSADLWSYGCVLHALVTGQSPFADESYACTVRRISLHKALADFDESRCDIPSEWYTLIQALVKANPNDRLGASDMQGPFVGYSSIRSTKLLTDVPEQDFLVWPHQGLDQPEFTSESYRATMRDGSGGWKAFLL